ncbi:MAG: hypothetical protein U1D67_05085 [Dehalococcoidia bacterium]|nr:hypothetical protein [Dehalococcoidia bacterium]MDZ4246479.1 hypothetical protein [Dehalococcoidia bacterium]
MGKTEACNRSELLTVVRGVAARRKNIIPNPDGHNVNQLDGRTMIPEMQTGLSG